MTHAFADIRDRLAHGHEHHGQRWELHVPREGEPASTARTLLLTLGLPTFGLAFAISMLTTYGPVVLIRLTGSPSQVGALIGAEGAFALVVPLAAGALSDRLRGTPTARRLPFILVGTVLIAGGLIALPFSSSIALAAVSILAFFIGYYAYYPPYRALYPDLLPQRLYARAQSSQAVYRGAGLGAALLAGGLLLSVWRPLPFALAAATVVATTFALIPVLRLDNDCVNPLLPYETVSLRRLLRNSNVRAVISANACWEFSFSGLKTFIVLYVVRGLGHSTSVASAVIAVVAVAYVVGAPIAGRLADKFGMVPVLRGAGLVYGVGLTAGVFATTLGPLVIALPIVALAGAIVLTLPQALLFSVAPTGSAGAAAGLLDFSRGVGVVLGPVVVGAVIQAFRPTLEATHGYAAMWPTVGLPVILSLVSLKRVRPTQ